MRILIALFLAGATLAQDRVVIQTGTLLDGKGGILQNQRITVKGGRIVCQGKVEMSPCWQSRNVPSWRGL